MRSQLLDIARSYFLENDGPRRPLWIKDGPCRQGIFNDLEKIFAAYSAGGLEGNAQNHQRFARLEEVAAAVVVPASPARLPTTQGRSSMIMKALVFLPSPFDTRW
jgi:hypothetical protein